MIRIEIIFDSLIEDIIMEAIEQDKSLCFFTHITSVKGQGFHEPKKNDEVWPGENSILIFYTAKEHKEHFIEIVKKIRENNPGYGIAMFAMANAEAF